MSVDRLGTPGRSAVILIGSNRKKKVALRTAPLRIVAAKRGRAQDAAQFRECLGCGELVPIVG
jgi:hypothetical protein